MIDRSSVFENGLNQKRFFISSLENCFLTVQRLLLLFMLPGLYRGRGFTLLLPYLCDQSALMRIKYVFGLLETLVNGKLVQKIKNLFSSITQTMNTVRAFRRFTKNPKQEFWKKSSSQQTYPSILLNPIYGVHGVMELPGIKLHYVECGQANKELLLFIHGFPDFWFSWKNQIKEFSKDYRVVAIDMRGYGESDKSKKISFYKIQLLVDDIRNFVLKLGAEKFTLIAHDWGGVIAHYFIRIHPEILNRYILMNTVFHPKLGDIAFSNRKQFLKSWYVLLMQIPYLPEFLFIRDDLKSFGAIYGDYFTPEELEAYKYTFRNYERIRGPINYYRANFRNWKTHGIPTAQKLNSYRIPGLYIHGEDDVTLTLKIAFDRSFEDVENIQCISIPHAGHFVHMHSPSRVNEIIRNFLESSKKR